MRAHAIIVLALTGILLAGCSGSPCSSPTAAAEPCTATEFDWSELGWDPVAVNAGGFSPIPDLLKAYGIESQTHRRGSDLLIRVPEEKLAAARALIVEHRGSAEQPNLPFMFHGEPAERVWGAYAAFAPR